MTKINTKKAGLSLIEVLFAMLFLSVIVFGVIKLQTSNMTLSNTKRLELKANSHSIQGLEIVGALGYTMIDGFYTNPPCNDDPVLCNCEITGLGPYGFACTGTAEDLETGMFERAFTLEPAPELNTLVNAYLVTSIVSWTDSSGNHSASAKRIIFN